MRLMQFGLYTLPLFSKRDQVGTGDASGRTLNLVSGSAYDLYGDERAPEQPTTLSTSYEIIASTATLVQTERDAIRALAGERALLWSQMPDGSLRHVQARLARVRMERRREHIYYQPVELTWDVVKPGWRGTGRGDPWTLDSGETLDSGLFLDSSNYWVPLASPAILSAANAGNRDVTAIVVTVTAGSDAISNVRMVCGDCDWTFGGTVAAGDVLIVDCDARSVTNDGADAYNSLTLNAGHKTADWLRIAAGGSDITLTYSGNSSDTARIEISYYDGWM